MGAKFEAAKIDAAAAVPAALAKAATARGQSVYVAELNKAGGLAGALDTWGIGIAAIEAEGWVLEHWAIAPNGDARPVFRKSLVNH